MRADMDLLSALKRRRRDHTLPREFYVDPEVYQADLDRIFYCDWLFAGHDCEIKQPGDYITLAVGDYPIVILRGVDGAIRAFNNSCRHRGSRICSAERGSAVRLVCPYHNWSYGLDGRLLFARDMDKPFDATALGLKPLHCQSVAGYIWICLADEPPEFETFRAAFEPYFKPHDIANAKVAFTSTIVENGNWKLVWENNRECYHCTSNHPELCLTYDESPAIAGVDGADEDPQVVAHWERMEQAGLPSRFELSADGKYRVTRMPLRQGAVSYTMSGRPAVRKPLSSSINSDDVGTLMMFNYPSVWNHIIGDHALTFRVLPIGPKQTMVTTKWLVNAEAIEGVDYDLRELAEVWLATNDQDRRIVEENQVGVSSPAFEPGPYNRRHEGGVIQFVEWYAETMELALVGGSLRGKVA